MWRRPPARVCARDPQDDYGKLEGYWMTDIGPLNQVMHLWSYKDLNERARLRARACQERALEQRIHSAHPSQSRAPGHPPAERSARACCAGEDGQRLRAAQLSRQAGRGAAVGRTSSPRRSRRARSIPRSSGSGPTEAASPTRSATSGPMPISMRARGARGAAVKDPGWQEFLKEQRRLLDEMHSTIMLPASHSPLK